ncbi:MAG: radical SAM protein [Anaerolineae bacterium]|nr:radical SAM protein [Anaerolineae bacterium]
MYDCFFAKMTRREFLKNTATLCVKAGLASIFLSACTPDTQPQSTPTSTVLAQSQPASTPTTVIATPHARQDVGFEPGYVKLARTGELSKRAEKLWAIMESCQLCPRQCRVNRLKGMSGFCHSPGATLVVASFGPHFGEERPLVGFGGSGTIFFTHCNLRCVFCQNWYISQLGVGEETEIAELAQMMLELQKIGCHNLNIVTPTHYSAHLVKALEIAVEMGVRLPIVYNTSGWERREILEILDGIVDIYLPDFKYWDSAMAAKYSSGAASYPEMTQAAILEMNRQVGVAKPAQGGILQRGLIIRHLVMPNNVAGSEQIMEWIATYLPKDTYVNIMMQYNPLFKALEYPEIARRITKEEYERVVRRAQELGLTNLDIQGYWWLR